MIPLVDTTLTPTKPKLYLCKPNGTIISILHEAFNIMNYQKLGSINELEFDIPTQIDIHHVLTDNPNIIRLKDRYLIKFVYDSNTEWYIINRISSNMTSTIDSKNVHAFGLAYELADKIIRSYTSTSLNASQTIQEVLADCIWDTGSIEADYDLLYRSMDISEATVLDAVQQIATTFGSMIVWDTVNREVDFVKLSENGVDRGLHFTYGNLLQSAELVSESDQMCTRYKVFGQNGISIQEVNPTGQNFLEDYTYFMTTDYMSQSLIDSITTYDALVLSKSGDFTSYLATKSGYEAEMTVLENAMTTLESELQIILDNIDIAQANRESTSELIAQKNAKLAEIESKQIEIDNKNTQISSIAIQITINLACSSSGNITITINGVTTTIAVVTGDSINTVATKINSAFDTIYQNHLDDGTTFTYKSSVLANVVTIYYYSSSDYADATITFNGGTTGVTATIVNTNNGISNLISKLQNDISIENNFTPSQIIERNMFIIEKVWSDENYIDVEDLYNSAITNFANIRTPQFSATIDVVNFLEILSEQRNWDKLNLGDFCSVYHEKLDIDINAKIIEVQHDFEQGTIKLVIANVNAKDLQNTDSLLDKLNKSTSASTTLNMERFKYNSAYTDVNEVQSILNAAWDTSLREIKSATEEKLSWDGRGLTSYNTSDPNKAIRIMHSCLGLTSDNFNSLDVAITPDGIFAERLIGQIIAGVNLTITTGEDGHFLVNETGVTINDLDLTQTRTDKTYRILENVTDGFKIQKNSGTFETPVWEDNFYISLDGVLTANDLIANKLIMKNGGDVLIDGDTKTIDFSKFLTIAGTINADNINLKGLNVYNALDELTLGISATGDISLKGNITMTGGSLIFTDGSISWSKLDEDATEGVTTIAEDWISTRKIKVSELTSLNEANPIIRLFSTEGTAQAGSLNTITLAVDASALNDQYNYFDISITSGTGSGQSNIISDYDGTTKIATVTTNWSVTPDNTSVYLITGSALDATLNAGEGIGDRIRLKWNDNTYFAVTNNQFGFYFYDDLLGGTTAKAQIQSDGYYWNSNRQPNIFVQESEPTSLTINDIWIQI